MIDFEVHGLEAAALLINRMAHFRSEQLLGVLGRLIAAQTFKHFETESGPDGAWAPLAVSTLSSKRGGSILTNTGRLRGSITAKFSSDQVEISTNVPYAKYHQHGTRKMPARPFIGLSASDEDEVAHTINRFMERLVL